MKAATIAALALAGVALASLAVRQAANVQADAAADAGESGPWLDNVNPLHEWEAMTARVSAEDSMSEANVRAFLTMIATAEGTEREPDPYRVCYGYRHVISDLSDHPAITGEWRGEKLPDHYCTGAGLSPGCVSTAAGRYQQIRRTWSGAKRALKLPDFSPESQDLACLYLIRKRGALDAVRAGRLSEAVALCRAEWASLPGNGAGQPQRRMSELVAAYSGAGGVLA